MFELLFELLNKLFDKLFTRTITVDISKPVEKGKNYNTLEMADNYACRKKNFFRRYNIYLCAGDHKLKEDIETNITIGVGAKVEGVNSAVKLSGQIIEKCPCFTIEHKLVANLDGSWTKHWHCEECGKEFIPKTRKENN